MWDSNAGRDKVILKAGVIQTSLDYFEKLDSYEHRRQKIRDKLLEKYLQIRQQGLLSWPNINLSALAILI